MLIEPDSLQTIFSQVYDGQAKVVKARLAVPNEYPNREIIFKIVSERGEFK